MRFRAQYCHDVVTQYNTIQDCIVLATRTFIGPLYMYVAGHVCSGHVYAWVTAALSIMH
jgi:hypothetical protein